MTICCFTCQVNADELFVGNERDNTVTVLDGERRNIIKTIFVDERPRGIVITPDHHREVLVCNGDNDDITIIDTSTLAVARTLQTGPDPENAGLIPVRRRDLRFQ